MSKIEERYTAEPDLERLWAWMDGGCKGKKPESKPAQRRAVVRVSFKLSLTRVRAMLQRRP